MSYWLASKLNFIIYNLYIDFLDFPVILSTPPFTNDMTQLD